MYFPMDGTTNKLEFSINSSAALIYMMRKQQDAVFDCNKMNLDLN